MIIIMMVVITPPSVQSIVRGCSPSYVSNDNNQNQLLSYLIKREKKHRWKRARTLGIIPNYNSCFRIRVINPANITPNRLRHLGQALRTLLLPHHHYHHYHYPHYHCHSPFQKTPSWKTVLEDGTTSAPNTVDALPAIINLHPRRTKST